ncbi:hypothetical protein GLOIN_2v1774909 [Rhizophagus irregularis DAOM 181602=DAOM 197198]|nr:hypothetical protein GLOIN_2v1774909 [Rhizophagus irregularis DAOM 181602=DAOM 197198]
MTLLSLINGLVKRCFQRCDAVNLKDLKDYIRELYKPPALGNDGAVIKFMSDEVRYSPREDAMCELYGLSEDPNPSIDVWIGNAHCDNPHRHIVLAHKKYLFLHLSRLATFPFKSQIKIVPEKLVKGKKWSDLRKPLYKWNKRKANELDDDYDMDIVWVIKPLFVAYEYEDMKDKADKVLGHIIWLLGEAQKPVETSQESRMKRVKSTGKEIMEIYLLRLKNGVDDKSARTSVYSEIKPSFLKTIKYRRANYKSSKLCSEKLGLISLAR